jgi:hypothetical protein
MPTVTKKPARITEKGLRMCASSGYYTAATTFSRGQNMPRITLCVGALMFAALPDVSYAQSASQPAGRWSVELYAGAASSADASAGTAGPAFPAGTPFTTTSGGASRIHSSWYFGDGATLLNQVLGQFAIINGTPFSRLVPLDAALTASSTGRTGGPTFGLRLSRHLSPRLTLDANVERSQGSLVLSDAARTAFESTRDSFKAAFEGLLATAPITALSVSSTMTVNEGSGSRTRVAAAARWTLVSGTRASAYATVGGGVIMHGGQDFQAIFNGSHSFRLFGAFPMSETDRVVVSVKKPSSAMLGLVGGGVTYDFSARLGLRVDVQVSLSPNSDVTTVSGSPNVGTLTPAAVLPSVTSPGIQFSSTPGVPSSLSGASTTYTTFTGSGLNRHVSFTVGLVRRF